VAAFAGNRLQGAKRLKLGGRQSEARWGTKSPAFFSLHLSLHCASAIHHAGVASARIKVTEAVSLPRRNTANKRHPCKVRRRRAVWRQAVSGDKLLCHQQWRAVVTVRAKARPSPARQEEWQECQRVSAKTPHPQGARAREQRESVRPSNLPRIFETLLIVTIPKRVRDKTPHSLHFTFFCALATDTDWPRL
jgi:hypothetical protein